ncbi:MAG: hypothetical protein ACI8W8_002024 [Rhodothermales bacterium]|jgi:uncharacterized protein (AIM24 family)
MRSHEVDYEIIGNDMQLVEVELLRGQRIALHSAAELTTRLMG